VATWNEGESSLYIDGIHQGSAKTDGLISYRHRSPFRVGHSHNSNAPHARDGIYYFKGTIDEVMVFERVLSKEEVRMLWEWTGAKPGGKPGAEP
jgi:hypothetical protein